MDGTRTHGLWRDRTFTESVPSPTESQAVVSTRGDLRGGAHESTPLHTVSAGFCYPVATARRDLPPGLLDVRQAARWLAVSTATVYALCKKGDLPHLRIGNVLRFAAADLAAALQAGRR